MFCYCCLESMKHGRHGTGKEEEEEEEDDEL